jgi:uncharacterized protein (DUF1778 family)
MRDKFLLDRVRAPFPFQQAEGVLTKQTRFVLPKAHWRAFNAALAAPTRKIPELKRLLTEPSIFEAR